MNDFIQNNIEFIIYLGSTFVAIIIGIIGIQRYFQKQRIELLDKEHKIALGNLKAKYDQECMEIKQKAINEKEAFKNTLKAEYDSKQSELLAEDAAPLMQEVKMVYVKYLHIRRSSEAPVYRKYINRLEEDIDVHSEYHYYRFNKYNNPNNSITITDRSSGIVDQNILYPWKKLTFTDRPSQKIKGIIAQDVENCDTYFSATTYYNGFKEENEDIGMKMEMETASARMVADFSSIVGLERLFTNEPDAYKIGLDGQRIRLLGLEKIGEGIYHLEANNLKKGESLLLDFHVNWDYWNDEED